MPHSKNDRIQLSEEELKVALDHCANEPIHIPGSIQPHGAMLVLDGKSKVVQQASENIEEFMDVTLDQVYGKTLDQLFGIKNAEKLMASIQKAPLQPIDAVMMTIKGALCDVVSTFSDNQIVVEIEQQPNDENYLSEKFYYDRLRNFAIELRNAEDVNDLYNLIVKEIFNLTNFDRVKLYQFDQDWNGEVIAEMKKDFMPSYLRSHFPSSDIPEQARKLYMKSYLRLIPDISYRPVPLVPEINPITQAPIDLGLSTLRSVSPIHIQYLDNMNIRGSMSISIVQNDKLWGLIACHHNSPIHIPYRLRMLAEIIGHIFSAQLSNMTEISLKEEQEKRNLFIEKLSSAMKKEDNFGNLFHTIGDLALDAMQSEGVAVYSSEEVLLYGKTPERKQMLEIFEWLKQKDIKKILFTDDTAYYNEPVLKGIDGGFMAVPISVTEQDYIIWFRDSVAKEITWAGPLEKNAQQTKAGYRLTPRSSFDLWRQVKQGKSEPWSADDLKTADAMTRILLEGKRKAADAANVAKSEFLANLSHELRTPMNAVIGLSHILEKAGPLNMKQQEYIKTMQSSANSLLALVNDLLDIAKIEARNVEFEAIAFSPSDVVREVVSMMDVHARDKGLVITGDTECIDNRIYKGDPTRIRQIIVNLCNNAIKFTDKGTVNIHVDCEDIDDPLMEKLVISIEDTGMGIAPEKLDSIFEKFVQADASINRKFGGTGLGLSITKTLTEIMGGNLSVTSELGKGSVFTLTLPLEKIQDKKPDESASSDISKKPDKESQKPHILLVEDYAANVLVATLYLEQFGYTYDVAENGSQAVEKIAANEYHVVLMDVQMPGMDGLSATKKVREMEQGGKRRVPIIGMTAHALAGDRERCIEAGMDDYVSKPFNPTMLQSKIESFIDMAA